MKPLFLRLTISRLIDERLTFNRFARFPMSGLTSRVVLSILLSRSRSICSGRSNGNVGGLPTGLPVLLCFFMGRIILQLVSEVKGSGTKPPRGRLYMRRRVSAGAARRVPRSPPQERSFELSSILPPRARSRMATPRTRTSPRCRHARPARHGQAQREGR